MKKRAFKIEVVLTYKGVYEVEAESQEEALRIIRQVGETCDKGYPSPGLQAQNHENIKDWDFNMIPDSRQVVIFGEGK